MEHAHISSFDGTELYVEYKLAKRIVVYVHGLGSHCTGGRYLGKAALKKGYGYVGMDLRGHGLSSGERGYVRSFHDYLQDVKAVLSWIRLQRPKADIVLVGHSMGTLISMRLVSEHDPQQLGISHVILVSPATKLSFHPSKLRLALGHVFYFIPGLDKKHFHVDVVPEFTTHDKREQLVLKKDTLLNAFVTPRLYFKAMRYMKWMRTSEFSLKVPLLVLIPGEDPTIDSASQKAFAERLLSFGNKVQQHYYEGRYHSLLLEDNREVVFKHIFSWLE